MSNEPLALFLTFTTYGTWLHGDERGSVDRSHRGVGDPPVEPSARRLSYVRSFRMREVPLVLDNEMRAVVHRAIEETCSIRRWSLLALNVRTNHVHAVVSGPAVPEAAMTGFKANATRLLAEAKLVGPGMRVWTRHGSTRYLWTEEDVANACTYTVDFQDGQSARWDAR